LKPAAKCFFHTLQKSENIGGPTFGVEKEHVVVRISKEKV
jgi:hypothetical protein